MKNFGIPNFKFSDMFLLFSSMKEQYGFQKLPCSNIYEERAVKKKYKPHQPPDLDIVFHSANQLLKEISGVVYQAGSSTQYFQ